MGTENPHKNTSKMLVTKKASQPQKFINKHIKDAKLNITLGEIIEYARWHAFEEGKLAGRNELRNHLKELLDIKDPMEY